MAKRKPGLEWLDLSDEATLKWAVNYLRNHGQPVSGLARQQTADTTAAKGLRLEETAEGRELLGKMQNAYRQGQWRKTKPGLRARTFRLRRESSSKLDALAKQRQVTVGELIEAFITDTAKTHAQINEKLKAAKQRQQEQKRNAQMREIHLRTHIAELKSLLSESVMKNSYYETVMCDGPVQGPPRHDNQERAANRFEQVMADTERRLKEIDKQQAGLHSMTRAMERD